MKAVEARVSGWGRFPVERCYLYRPHKRSEVARILASAEQPSVISRGLGRSYGDAALNADRGVISHLRLNRFLGFDAEKALLECEAGTTLEEIIATFLPRGFFLPVTPGTKYVTVGGAIAADVHGKNHHADGTFAEFLVDFQLQLPSGSVLVCSRDRNPEAFWATLGGMGLTGSILSARLRLRPIESAYVKADYRKTRDLDETLGALAESDMGYRYSVAWIDCVASGSALGRSVLMQANDASAAEVEAAHPGADPLAIPPRRRVKIPIDFPSALLNRLSIRAFNSLYFRSHRSGTGQLVDYERYFYPLDALAQWNRLYGKRGFAQYQVVLPSESAHEGLAALIERLHTAGRASFLAVVKRFGAANPGLLSFPHDGYTLALDLPNKSGLPAFLRELDAITLHFGGRVYLAKDAVLTPETFAAMYPHADEFRRIRETLDPDGRLDSSLARRVGLTRA